MIEVQQIAARAGPQLGLSGRGDPSRRLHGRSAARCAGGRRTACGDGVAGAGQEIHARPFLLVTGRSWRGSAFGGVRGRTQLPQFVDRYLSGRIKLDEMVNATMPLEEINNAFEKMHKGEVIRSVLIY